jgi:hypothetical protein
VPPSSFVSELSSKLSIFVTVGFITIFIFLRRKYCDFTICTFF